MVKKLFALASVSALAGIVAATGAGCTTETVVPAEDVDAGPKDAGRDRAVVDPGDDDDDDEIPSCAAKEPVTLTKIPYTTALQVPGACTTADLAKLVAYFDANREAKDFTVAKWAAEVSETCSQCVFTDEAAEKWGPLLVKDDELNSLNYGGCIEIQSDNEACGRAYQQFRQCPFQACVPTQQGGESTCKTQDEFDACMDDLQGLYNGGPCEASLVAAQKECGANVGAYEEACKPPTGAKYIFEPWITAHCISGESPDAGE